MDAIELLLRFIGCRLARLRRVFFTHRGIVAKDAGPLELDFGSDQPVLLDVGTDGESLATTHGAWEDPLGRPYRQRTRSGSPNTGSGRLSTNRTSPRGRTSLGGH
jgi:hypothetical protein